MYDSEGRVQEEKSYKERQAAQRRKTYFTTGKVEREVNYRNGKQDGKDMVYEWDGTLRRGYTYKDGKQVGKQFTFLKGTYELYETEYYNEYGMKDGEYSSMFTSDNRIFWGIIKRPKGRPVDRNCRKW